MCDNTYVNIQTGETLDIERVLILENNVMLSHSPRLFEEWDFEKNDELGLDVYKVTKGSNKKAWWICSKCNNSYFTRIADRSKNNNCPYCLGRRVNNTNSLEVLNPELAKQWHPAKNGDLIPNNFSVSSDQKVWWIGECGHEWDARIADRSKGNNCPYCCSRKVLRGFNDMWTTNPELAKFLLNKDDGYSNSSRSNKKVDWICSCGEIYRSKIIGNIYKDGISCAKCSRGISIGEKSIYALLKKKEINFKWDTPMEWSEGKRYDFYIHELNMIIEVHGRQHYENSNRGRSLEEEQENDRIKELLAKKNNVNNYIVIDARYSNLDHIKNSIISSKLNSLLNITDDDFKYVGEEMYCDFTKKAIDLWNSGMRKTKTIANELGLSRVTVIDYLKSGSVSGLCDYEVKKGSEYNKKTSCQIVI